jgi:hypothetical protein
MNIRIPSLAEFREGRREADLLTEGIIGNLIAGASGWVRGALKGLVSPFTDLARQIKQDWRDGVTAEKLRDALTAAVEASYASLSKQVDQAKEAGEVEQLLQKAVEVNANMANTIKAQLKGLQESWELVARLEPVNESGVRTATKVGYDVASRLVDGIMRASGNGLQHVLAKAKESAKNHADLARFKHDVKGELFRMAKASKEAIAKLDTQQLLDMKRDDQTPEAARNKELLKRREAKYSPGDKVTYINRKGKRVTGLVSKDLGDAVQFQSKEDENASFKKNKVDVVGLVAPKPKPAEERAK